MTYACPTCSTYRTYYKSDLPRHQASCQKLRSYGPAKLSRIFENDLGNLSRGHGAQTEACYPEQHSH